MHNSIYDYAKKYIFPEIIKNKRILEIGSLNMNGSLREFVSSFHPKEYIGIDIVSGKGVDQVLDARSIVDFYSKESFDFILCTEVIEHTYDWKGVIRNIKKCLKPNGYIFLTTRSIGFSLHLGPYDFWRYSLEDLKKIFIDFEPAFFENDPEDPGVIFFGEKTKEYDSSFYDLYLFSMITNKASYNINKDDLKKLIRNLKLFIRFLENKITSLIEENKQDELQRYKKQKEDTINISKNFKKLISNKLLRESIGLNF